MSHPDLHWKINTPAFLDEVAKGSGQSIYRIPLNLLKRLLAAVARRASELNDDELNGLMARLALYEQTDPYSKQYDSKLTSQTIRKGELAARRHQRDRTKILQDPGDGGSPVGGAAHSPQSGATTLHDHGRPVLRSHQGAGPDGAERQGSRGRARRAGK